MKMPPPLWLFGAVLMIAFTLGLFLPFKDSDEVLINLKHQPQPRVFDRMNEVVYSNGVYNAYVFAGPEETSEVHIDYGPLAGQWLLVTEKGYCFYYSSNWDGPFNPMTEQSLLTRVQARRKSRETQALKGTP